MFSKSVPGGGGRIVAGSGGALVTLRGMVWLVAMSG